MINPNNKLPPSPKNSLGNPRKEKLKNKKKIIGIIIITKKNWIFCSETKKCEIWLEARKQRITSTETDTQPNKPSTPSIKLNALVNPITDKIVKGIKKYIERRF